MRNKYIVLLGVLLILSISLLGCGGGGGASTPAQVTPSISSLQYSPTAAYVNSGGGTATVSGTFDFADPNGNLATLTVTVFDSKGQQVLTSTNHVTGASGVTAGTIFISGSIDTTMIGQFTFQVFVTDTTGFNSNILAGAFRVSDDPWKSKNPMPTVRVSFATVTLNGQVFAIGGEVVSFPVTTVEAYNPATDTWTMKSPLPTARAGLVAAIVNGKIYAIGGRGEFTPGGLGTVEEYNPITDSWATKSSMPTPRSYCAASVVNGIIYVTGGSSGGNDLNTVEAYDPATDSWTTLSAMPTARRNLTSSAVNGKIYAVGGYLSTSIAGYLNTVEEYDPATNSWNVKAPMPIGRENMASGVINGMITVVGGDNAFSRGLDTTSEYDPANDAWKAKTSMPSGAVSPLVSPLAADVANGKLYVIGGLVTYEYTPSNDIL